MWFKFFRHKQKEEPRTFEGRFISDEEIDKMSTPKNDTFIKKGLDEINDMMKDLKKYIE